MVYSKADPAAEHVEHAEHAELAARAALAPAVEQPTPAAPALAQPLELRGGAAAAAGARHGAVAEVAAGDACAPGGSGTTSTTASKKPPTAHATPWHQPAQPSQPATDGGHEARHAPATIPADLLAAYTLLMPKELASMFWTTHVAPVSNAAGAGKKGRAVAKGPRRPPGRPKKVPCNPAPLILRWALRVPHALGLLWRVPSGDARRWRSAPAVGTAGAADAAEAARKSPRISQSSVCVCVCMRACWWRMCVNAAAGHCLGLRAGKIRAGTTWPGVVAASDPSSTSVLHEAALPCCRHHTGRPPLQHNACGSNLRTHLR